jgi:hypothetical protein
VPCPACCSAKDYFNIQTGTAKMAAYRHRFYGIGKREAKLTKKSKPDFHFLISYWSAFDTVARCGGKARGIRWHWH